VSDADPCSGRDAAVTDAGLCDLVRFFQAMRHVDAGLATADGVA